MSIVQPGSIVNAVASQGSSGAKVLADYAAMSIGNDKSESATGPAAKTEGAAPSLVKTDTNQHAGATASREIGGRQGPEPTRFGDWEKSGRCIDF